MVGLPNPGSGLAGNVYVYQLVGSAWTLVQTLPGVFVNDNFGASVAYDDSIGALIIGATGVGSVDPSGRAYYYQRQGSGLFAQVGTYFTGSDVSATALFGTLVSVSGTNVAVSAPTQTGGGAVYYFTIAVSTSVTQRQKLTVGGSLALGTKGLAVYGTHLMVSDYNNATHFNNVYAYELTAGSYGLIQTIAHPTANDKDFGGPIFIGSAGALLSAIANAATPSVYYYTYAAGTWTQAQHLTDGAAASGYGVTTWSVVSSALGNTMLYVGCTDPTQGLYTYYLNGGGTWTLNQNLIPGHASSNVAGTGEFLFAITNG
jgi:hypothetical protein